MDSKTPTNSSPPPRTHVKKESEEEIKEFAETAMNELLGWYGYERLELRRWAASRARDNSSPEQAAEQKNKDECSWCNKNITSESGALQQAGAAFCSELCFSQSRRANFKRAKTCDWCRHVRHTVAYVDFQDGATQLQFCSDKCLNQYKMHIFCRETQAHLDLNPHLVTAPSSTNLITPELWLKNCKSRSVSPASERSGSPNPENMAIKPTVEKTDLNPTRKSPLPLITVAPAAKLMNPRTSEEKTIQKSPELKKDRVKMNARKRRTSKCSATITSQNLRQHNTTPKAQDLRLCSPSLDGSSPSSTIGTAGTSVIHSPPHSINHSAPPPFNTLFGMPPPLFAEAPTPINDHRYMFQPRLGFMPRPGLMQERPPLIPPLNPPLNFPQPLGQAPPVTVLVPYPVILPIPLPIPVPIPITSFLQAHLNKVKTETNNEESEGPLDFTMNSDKKRVDNSKDAENIEIQAAIRETTMQPINEENERIDDVKNSHEISVTGNAEQTLPKFKITRLGNKMAKIVAKTREPSESTRPLRKRRRLVEVTTEDDPLIPKSRKIVEV